MWIALPNGCSDPSYFSMTASLSSSLTRIREQRLSNLELGPQAVHPAYHGLSILNVPASVANWLGAPGLPHPPVDLSELDELAGGARQVVVVLVDAVGLDAFERWIEGRAGSLKPLVERGTLCALTSVVPSTTTAALTTLWTGRSPAEHGVVGYELFLREFGMVVNMINHAPASFDGEVGSLSRAGFDPNSFLPMPTLGSHLSASDVEAHAYLYYRIAGSGLSQMHYSDVELHSWTGLADLWISIRQLLESDPKNPRLIWAYYGGVDNISHLHGPQSERAEAEFAGFADSMMSNLIYRLTPEARRDTVLVLMSDHGQIGTRKDPHFELRNHPDLIRRLHLQPTGENRLAYIYPKPGQTEAVQEYIERTWPRSFKTLPSSHALQAGLFGPGEPAAVTPSRIGDSLAISQGEAYFWWAAKENPLLGRHGGLTADEMLVPFLVVRLDG